MRARTESELIFITVSTFTYSTNVPTKFKEVGEAYQVLSDETMRKRYDELGYEAAKAGPEGGFADPREIFRQIFGGEPFVDIIGELSFVKMFVEQQEEDGGGPAAANEAIESHAHSERRKREERQKEEKRIRKERVAELEAKLFKKINLYTEGNFSVSEFQEYIKEEAMRLSKESLGTELLHAVGYTYEIRARQHLGRDELLGLTGFYHSIRERGHTVSNIFSTVKAATKAISSARNIQEMNDKSVANGTGPIEPSNQMVREAGDNMKNLLVKAVTIEVQSVIGEVCDEILEMGRAPNLAAKAKKADLKKRAEALKIIGKIYSSTPAPPPQESNNFF